MAAMLYGIAILTTLFETVATSDMHCTSFQRQPLHVGEGPTRLSCPGPRCTHAPSGNFTRKVAAPSAVMCGLICMRDGGCESFRYCQEQNLCQLNTTLPEVAMKTLRATRCVLFDQEIQEETKEGKHGPFQIRNFGFWFSFVRLRSLVWSPEHIGKKRALVKSTAEATSVLSDYAVQPRGHSDDQSPSPTGPPAPSLK